MVGKSNKGSFDDFGHKMSESESEKLVLAHSANN